MLLLALLLCACAVETPSPTPASAAAAALPPARPTLPPTWTPTFTPTPPPPSPTPTPTLTPTVTRTPSAAAICDGFSLTSSLGRGRIHAWTHHLSLIVTTTVRDVVVRLTLTHTPSGAARTLELPGGTLAAGQWAVAQLGQPGPYTWSLAVYSPLYGEICPQSGWFIAAGPESTRAEERRIR